ncbi:CaiB/BaiF CoA transferase family protein [Halorientalis litorea]|jgi:crotonobetainyl-CoA:carnitine CoA-transferase CaiB-like acyl-CoA transferase|uniref:CaiB/BaiF CoA transferase family protein n=1 Tax=Halorientalis litorea TaxID=2931977 RepID=UPI001FF54A2F|nr:CoA transferase [Halorientalis litorea]
MQPFEDIDVLDLTQSIAGPVATQFLGALGANVVKVEPVEGDRFRNVLDGAMFASVNLADKRSVCLDLKSDAGKRAASDLAAEADVVVESFRPGVMERFGLDYESVAADNEDVVYLSLTGFGQDGPYSDRPAYDPIIQAMSGLMSTIGYPDRPPVRIGASVIDWGTGTTAAFSLASALLHREATGEGQRIDVNLFEVAVTWMGYWISHYSGSGENPERSGQGFAGLAPNEVFNVAGDGNIYMCVFTDGMFADLCDALDREELVTDERFETNDARWAHRETLKEILEDEFADYDREELCEQLATVGIPAGPVQSVEELVEDDPHLAARELLVESHNVLTDTPVETAGVPFTTSEGRPDISGRPPELGEHTRAVLEELGYDDETVSRMLAAADIAD